MLARWCMRYSAVDGGPQALRTLQAARDSGAPFQLILTDMHMSNMDGFDLVAHIREQPALSATTIMMLSCAGHRGDAECCEQMGVAAYLLKPIRQSELREAVARVFGSRKQDGAAPLITRFAVKGAAEPGEGHSILVAEDNR
jgi:two-component system sensor histidine kinase/response regulator